MKTRFLVASTLMAVAAVGTTVLLLQPHSEIQASAVQAVSDSAELRAELEQLRRQVAAMRSTPRPNALRREQSVSSNPATAALIARLADAERQLAALQRSAGAGSSPVSSVNPEERAQAARQSREDAIERDEAYTVALQNALESRFFDENLDPHWAKATQDSISRGLLDQSFSGNQLSEVQCQSSLCRMEIRSASHQAQERLMEGYVSLEAFANNYVFSKRNDQPDGSSVTTVYLMREGSTMPSVPRPGQRG